MVRCERALGVFSDLGYRVKALTPSISPDALWKSWTDLRSWAIASGDAALLENPATCDRLKPELAWEIERGLTMSGADVHAASVIRSAWFCEFAAMQDIDFLALPSAQMFAFDATFDWPKSVAGQAMDTYHRWMEVVIPASLIGVPALSVPAGFGDGGTPMGLQLIAKRGTDALVLGAGQQYHLATGWPDLMAPPNAMRG